MALLSVKIPAELQQRLNAAVKTKRMTKSSFVREALDFYFKQETHEAGGSCLDLISDLVGRFEGPEDLATNKKYMKGFGR